MGRIRTVKHGYIWIVVAILAFSGSLAAGRQGGGTAARPAPAVPAAQAAPAARTYGGLLPLKQRHAADYERWSKTRMANVVTDPKQHPEVVLPDFNKPDPLLTFKLDDVAFVYGTKWKQRYFTKVGNDYFPLGAQWDVTHKQWRPYLVANNTDWW